MQKFKYSPFAKFIYRYANIPLTILLVIHLIATALGIPYAWYLVIPAAINLAILIWINRFYFKSYKTFPFKIEADNDKMICSDFMSCDEDIEIQHINIDKIEGGVFSRNLTRPIYITDTTQGVTIGIHNHLKGFNKLLTIILSNIKHELYTELLERIKEQAPKKKG